MKINEDGYYLPSLFEFTEPLNLPAVIEEFKSTPNFSGISLKSMFLDDNIPAFNKALDETIQYNAAIIQRQKLHNDLKIYFSSKVSTKVVLDESLKRVYSEYDETLKENFISNKRSKQG